MEYILGHTGHGDEIIRLFKTTFAASEGDAEGDRIASLVVSMLDHVAPDDIVVVAAVDNGTLVGAVIFSRMIYSEDERTVFILSPAAVATSEQGKGIGQALISQGLQCLRENGVKVVLTYGDPSFYSRVGFEQITEEIARPPLPLSYPAGWLGQSLTAKALQPLRGQSTCVAPLNDPALW